MDSSHIIITLGTSWVYKHIEQNSYVANCHKISQKEFSKELLTVDEISQSLNAIINLISTVNSGATIILTVSPVRHLRDGFIENTQSKSHLFSALHSVLSHRAQSRCHYFPSFEIMLDELRDYRFYAEDMIHPNTTAINYIWEKFQQVWISPLAKESMDDVDDIQKGLLHKAFSPNSEGHQKFLAVLDAKKKNLKALYKYISFDE
jgi:hypothetical protein